MEEPSTSPATQDSRGPSAWQRNAGCLLVLLSLATGVRSWEIGHTSVAARDSIGFIRYAWKLEHEPWIMVFRDSLHPPLYPVTVLAVSVPVRHLLGGGADPVAMQYSAQIASALAGILLVIPTFYLGKELFDRSVGFWSALLFQFLPVGSHALSDGLTEGIFLLLTATFLVLAGRALRRRSVLYFGLCGLCSGLAYLARPEGAGLCLVLGLVLLIVQVRRDARWSMVQLTHCLTSLAYCALMVAAPYAWVIGGFTNKTSAQWIIESEGDNHLRSEAATAENEPRLAYATLVAEIDAPRADVLPGILLADWRNGWNAAHHESSLKWGIRAFAMEVSKGFNYFAWFPALLGLWWFRQRARENPTAWVMGALCLVFTLLLLRLAVVAGYLSERHSLIFVLCGVPWAVAGMVEWPRRMTALGRRLGFPPLVTEWAGYGRTAEVVFLAVLVFNGLPATLKPLHHARLGFREAGFWIAAHADPSDEVVDPFCWSEFYAGRVFTEGQHLSAPSGHEPTRYVVLDTPSPGSEHHSHLPRLAEAKQLAAMGRLVYHWPVGSGAAVVSVYAVPAGKP